MEGAWERPPPGTGEPLRLFALPDTAEQRNHFELAIPRIASLYLRHDLSSSIRPLTEFAPEDIPPVAIVFWAFRLMVGLGVLIVVLGITSLVLRHRQRFYTARWMHRCSVLMAPAGFMAMISGWVVTEVGRQPFTVYGLLRTADSASPISSEQVIVSTGVMLMFYLMVFGIGLWVLLRILRHPAKPGEQPPQPTLPDEIGKP